MYICMASAARHVIITGANTGIGKATAIELAKQGLSVTLACRTKENGDKAAREIAQLCRHSSVRAMMCDLASFESIRQFVENYRQSGLPLHALINNAGIMACPQTYTKHGFEQQLAVNHLGHFLLTLLLLDILVASASSRQYSRVVTVTSAAARMGDMDFEDLHFKRSRGYNPWAAYAQSKLANSLFSFELSRLCTKLDLPVTSNCMHPGIVDTRLIRYILPQVMSNEDRSNPGFRKLLLKLFGLRTAKEGASTAVFLACSQDVEGLSGHYFESCRELQPSSNELDPLLSSKLWRVSEELTKTTGVLEAMQSSY